MSTGGDELRPRTEIDLTGSPPVGQAPELQTETPKQRPRFLALILVLRRVVDSGLEDGMDTKPDCSAGQRLEAISADVRWLTERRRSRSYRRPGEVYHQVEAMLAGAVHGTQGAAVRFPANEAACRHSGSSIEERVTFGPINRGRIGPMH
jgi:hypothetical protein